MKFTLAWLRDHLDTDATVDTLVEVFPRIGFEVASVLNPARALEGFCVADIRHVMPHPDADRLQVCRVWTGEAELQVVCGAPNARVGLKSILATPGLVIPATGVALKKGMIRGVESQGMLCSLGELGLESPSGTAGSDGIMELSAECAAGTSAALALGLTDSVIDIEITPNRGDMLGVRGIARELVAAQMGTLRPLRAVPDIPLTASFPLALSRDPGLETLCPALMMVLIEGACDAPSAPWMQDRLQAVGSTPLSALVDITNFMLFDQNRPLHAFDADQIQGAVRLRLSEAGESFDGLDGQTYTLKAGLLVLSDAVGVMALCGILGGQRTACTPQTTRVILECADFAPEKIYEAGHAMGIGTQARMRFERGICPTSVRTGAAQAVALIQAQCGGRVSAATLIGGESLESPRPTRTLRLSQIRDLGGLDVDQEKVVRILSDLEFAPKVLEEGATLSVTVPSFRSDVDGEADLVEEVLRHVGFDTIPPVPLPHKELTQPALSPPHKVKWNASFALAARGVDEVITWSFMAPSKAILFGGGQADLILENPISVDLAVMRPSPLPHLLDLALMHQNRSLPFRPVFEVGPRYEGLRPEDQENMAALLMSACPTNLDWTPKSDPDIFTVKAHVWAVLRSLGVPTDKLTQASDAPDYYHPGRSGTLSQGQRILAVWGQVHPRIQESFGLENAFLAAEIFIDRVAPLKEKSPPALELSAYQPVERDLALVVPLATPADAVLKSIQRAAGPDLQRVILFDVFDDPTKMGPHHKSLAFRLTFQSMTGTLSENQIQGYVAHILEAVRLKVGAILRE